MRVTAADPEDPSPLGGVDRLGSLVTMGAIMMGVLVALLLTASSLEGLEGDHGLGPEIHVASDTLVSGDDMWARPVHPGLKEADSLFFAGDPEGALARALEVARVEGGTGGTEAYEPLWRAASYALAVGILKGSEGGGDSFFQEALRLAERARTAKPDGVAARYWEVAALGQMALGASGREAADYAEGIRGGALAILEVDPTHAGAHHALGKLYLEIMGVSGVSRLLGRTFTDSKALEEASWPRAERHLKKAVEMAPGMLLFQLDLARFHQARQEMEEAREILERLVEASIHQPPDRVFQEEGRAILKRIS
jgi:tetratricopeptide (TPR) repeat protein